MINYGSSQEVEHSLELDFINVIMWKFKVHFLGGKYMKMLKNVFPLLS